ncbi:tRNA 2-thiouridine(34) synthase MnmA [bacterium]|nr:tRNA 2-thiouridine(34) synthase MnmA [bacterium]
MNKPSVAVAMSGGVDSSTTAALLAQAGYDIVGFTLKLWDAADNDYPDKPGVIPDHAADAKRVCEIIGIPHHLLDVRDEFSSVVMDRFEREYFAGRTPNPCVGCNANIKWGLLWENARSLGLERLATGHYARLEIDEKKTVRLLRGVDPHKEQSYFLWQIPKEHLLITMFPLGDKTKPDVREIASRLKLHVADKNESQEVCFIPGNDYRTWLSRRNPDLENGLLGGDMVNESGDVLRHHSGYHLYTIGQRKGLGLGGGSKLYVTAINQGTHTVTVGSESGLYRSEFEIDSVNCLDPELYNNPEGLIVKIRYRDPGVGARVEKIESDRLLVRTAQPVSAVTPGQSAVFYKGDRLLGGGVIL